MSEILTLYTNILKQSHDTDSRIVEGALFGLGMLNIDQPDMGIDIEAFRKLSIKDSLDWENKKALAFGLNFISSKKLRKQALNIAKDYCKDSLGNVRKLGGIMIAFHEKQSDILKKYIEKSDKYSKQVIQGIYLGCALQRYTDFMPHLLEAIKTEIDEFQKLDLVFSYVLLGLYYDPLDLSKKIMELYKTESKLVRRILLNSLSLLIVFIDDYSENIQILKFLCENTRVLEKYSALVALVLSLVTHSFENTDLMWQEISSYVTQDNEFFAIRDLWQSLTKGKQSLEPVTLMEKISNLDYLDVKLATIYSSFFIDKNLSNSNKTILADIIAGLVNYRIASVRDLAISRLLSFSLKYKTQEYLDYFTEQLKLTGNIDESLYISLAWGIISEFGQKDFERVYEESKVYQNPIVQKGVLIGLGIAYNSKIDKEWIDEKFLGFYEVFKGHLEHALIFLYLSHYFEQKDKKESLQN